MAGLRACGHERQWRNVRSASPPGSGSWGVRVVYAGMADGERTTSQDSAERGLLDYLRILWRHKLLIAMTVIVTTGAAVGLDHFRTRTYQGTAEVLFTAQGASSPSSTSNLSAADVATDIELIGSAPVQAAVAKILHTAAPAVTATEVGATNVAHITVRSPSPDYASAAANAYARAYIQVATQAYVNSQLAAERQIQTQLLGLQTRINTIQQTPGSATSPTLQEQLTGLETGLLSFQQQLSQLQTATAQGASAGQLVVPAVPDPVPVSPKRTQDAVIAIGVGLLLGIGLALLRENLDDRVRGKDQLEQLMPGIPVLGVIPVIDHWRDRKRPYLVAQAQPRSPPSEAYRGLRTSVQFMALENPPKVLQITSPSAGDGKTTTSANLAWIMADAGQRVVLIGCDLRQPRIHEFFGLPNDVGFTSVLLGEAELDDALLSVPNQPGLLVVPTGPVPPNPSELLSSARTKQVFENLGAYADMVIVDSAPVLPVTDAAVLSTHADAILLVVYVGMDNSRDVVRSVEILNQINAPIAGIVLNRAPETDSSASYHYRYEEKSSYKGKPKDHKKRDAPVSTNGNGRKVVHDLSPVKNLPAIEDESVDWPVMGRHAKVEPPPLSDSPALFPPQTGDTPRE
jgi:tyrosine-protein kinase